jgi:metal-sulfur cluster biosynthetic enzyme
MAAVELIREQLKAVIDPELNVNIVDLGLVYDIANNNGDVKVTMTLTTPGCPLHTTMTNGVRAALHGMEGVQSVEVEVVWSPPWTPAMMSESAKERLGVY